MNPYNCTFAKKLKMCNPTLKKSVLNLGRNHDDDDDDDDNNEEEEEEEKSK
jgi:hypothetical protein